MLMAMPSPRTTAQSSPGPRGSTSGDAPAPAASPARKRRIRSNSAPGPSGGDHASCVARDAGGRRRRPATSGAAGRTSRTAGPARSAGALDPPVRPARRALTSRGYQRDARGRTGPPPASSGTCPAAASCTLAAAGHQGADRAGELVAHARRREVRRAGGVDQQRAVGRGDDDGWPLSSTCAPNRRAAVRAAPARRPAGRPRSPVSRDSSMAWGVMTTGRSAGHLAQAVGRRCGQDVQRVGVEQRRPTGRELQHARSSAAAAAPSVPRPGPATSACMARKVRLAGVRPGPGTWPPAPAPAAPSGSPRPTPRGPGPRRR
jgi:hypothetical protein